MVCCKLNLENGMLGVLLSLIKLEVSNSKEVSHILTVGRAVTVVKVFDHPKFCLDL